MGNFHSFTLMCVSWMTVDSRLKSETTTAASMTSIIRLKAWNQCWVRRSSAGTRSMWPLWPWHRPPILQLPFWVRKMDIWKRYVFFSEWPIVCSSAESWPQTTHYVLTEIAGVICIRSFFSLVWYIAFQLYLCILGIWGVRDIRVSEKISGDFLPESPDLQKK